MPKYHKVSAQIIELLKEHDVWFETFEHEPVRTSEEAAGTRDGYTLRQGAKALIVRLKLKSSTKFAMLVLPGDMRFDASKIKGLFSAKAVSFASEEEVLELTGGVLPGGVPPFGNLFGLEVVVEQSLFENEKIVFNAGDKRFSIAMKSADYMSIVKPKVEPIAAAAKL